MGPGRDRLTRRQDRVGQSVSQLARFPQRVLTAVALACAALVALVFGVIDVLQRWETDELTLVTNLREGVFITAGVFLFGAGLLYLASGRIEDDPGRLRLGGALAVLGVAMPVALGLGAVLHEGEAARLLSPVLVTVAALATLAVLTTTGPGTEGFWRRPGALITLCAVVVLTVALAATAYVASWRLDPPTWLHVGLELVVAGLFVAAAVAVRTSRRGPFAASADLDSLILAALGGVWLLRAVAAYDVAGWGVSPALLLLAVAVVAASHAMAYLVTSVESERHRVEVAERAAQQALEQLAAGSEQRAVLRHGVRNSLYALRMAAEALAEHGEALDPEGRRRLQQAIRDESAALSRLVEDAARSGDEVPG